MAKEKTIIEFAHLHTELFLEGKNHQTKLYRNTSTGLDMWFDYKTNMLNVTFKGALGLIPVTNVSSMTPAASSEIKSPKKTHIAHASRLDTPAKAQVSDPTTTVQNPR